MAKPWDNNSAIRISLEQALNSTDGGRQAAHAMIYSASSKVLFGYVPMRYNVLMGLRFDGLFGFPGGFVENKQGRCENIEDGLNRELVEEINLDEKFKFTKEDYLSSYLQTLPEGRKLINHFYVKQISEADFLKMEKRCMKASDWGTETLGIVRVPVHDEVYYNREMPIISFLQNGFVGNARQELVEGLIYCNILSETDMINIWKCLPKSHQ